MSEEKRFFVFVPPTFRNMKVERNELIFLIFPVSGKFCRERRIAEERWISAGRFMLSSS